MILLPCATPHQETDPFFCREEDVSQTLYKDTLKGSNPESDTSAKSKVSSNLVGNPKLSKINKINRICDAFLEALKNKMDTNLQNLITAHVCKSPPDLDSGLKLVADLRGLSPSLSQVEGRD